MSSIIKAMNRAFDVKKERGWDTIYYCVDLHGVCLKSNYETGKYEWINDKAKYTLQMISNRKDSKIILWSSVYPEEMGSIINFFQNSYIDVYGFNGNIFEPSNDVSCFDEKFYFSVLFDDKAGFDPETDWDLLEHFIMEKNCDEEESFED